MHSSSFKPSLKSTAYPEKLESISQFLRVVNLFCRPRKQQPMLHSLTLQLASSKKSLFVPHNFLGVFSWQIPSEFRQHPSLHSLTSLQVVGMQLPAQLSKHLSSVYSWQASPVFVWVQQLGTSLAAETWAGEAKKKEKANIARTRIEISKQLIVFFVISCSFLIGVL